MKKYFIYTLLLFLVLIGFFSTIQAKVHIPLVGKVVVVDAGHGGADPGTLYGSIYEKNINLSISKYLKDVLEKGGATVFLTRDGDYDLAKPNAMYRKKSDFDNRIKLINESKADLYLSIHLNYLNDSSYYGPQVFYQKGNEKLATKIQHSLNKKTKTDRNIKPIPKDTYMYRQLNVSGVLVECGFLSNAKEREKLNTTSYQQQLAKAIYEGIILYFT